MQSNDIAVLSRTETPLEGNALAIRLLDMIGASWMSQAICVAAELRIPDLLGRGAQRVDELAAATQCSRHALLRLLRGLASLGLCNEENNDTYSLTPLGELLRTDAPSNVRSWAIWWGRHLWPVWQDLKSSVATGKSARELATGRKGYAHVEADPEAASIFNNAMAEITRIVAAEALRVYDFSSAARLVDVGGGYGEFLTTLLAAHPHAQGVLFDLPHAIDAAKVRMTNDAVAARIACQVGSFFDSVPSGGDLYLLKSILHNWSDERVCVILGHCRRAMSGQAKLVLIERVMPVRMSASAREQALARTDLNMLVGLGGRERTASEISALLDTCGFRAAAFLPVTPEYTLIEATCRSGNAA